MYIGDTSFVYKEIIFDFIEVQQSISFTTPHEG